jgi:hypothetical protein
MNFSGFRKGSILLKIGILIRLLSLDYLLLAIQKFDSAFQDLFVHENVRLSLLE